MAKVSTVVKNNKRISLANKLKKRAELRKVVNDPNVGDEEKLQAQFKLQRLPRNSAMVRVRNRCEITAVEGTTVSLVIRIKFRELSLQGLIPGVKSLVGRQEL